MTQAASNQTNILSLVNSTLELPTMPEVLVKLNEVMANPDASSDDVAAVIGKDPAVATNVLRIVNSAYYGLQVRVSSVSLAVSVMGFNMAKKVALRASVYRGFRAPTLNELYRPFQVGTVLTEANPALRPETLWGAEAGPQLALDDVVVRATGFYNRLGNAVANLTL